LIGEHLKAAGMIVWDAAIDIEPGENLGDALSEALNNSDAMVALISPASGQSPWVSREIEFALTHPRYQERLIPVLVRPTRDFPWILNRLQFIDATVDSKDAPNRVIEALRQPRKAIAA
jgi:hypothetical protein